MWLDRLKQMKEESGLTTREISAKSGIPEPTLEKLFAGATKDPKLGTIQQLVRFFGKTLDDLDDAPQKIKNTPSLSDEALKVARDYSDLDQPGKNVVKVVISEEGKRVQAERERRQVEPTAPSETRLIPLYYTPAAAGMMEPAAGEDFDYIEVGSEVPRKADCAIKISGDSMEPYIRDGSIVYVTREPLENGDVGIFYVDGDMLCKQYYRNDRGNVHLISLNRERSDADRFIHAKGDTDMVYYGRVILPRKPIVNLS